MLYGIVFLYLYTKKEDNIYPLFYYIMVNLMFFSLKNSFSLSENTLSVISSSIFSASVSFICPTLPYLLLSHKKYFVFEFSSIFFFMPHSSSLPSKINPDSAKPFAEKTFYLQRNSFRYYSQQCYQQKTDFRLKLPLLLLPLLYCYIILLKHEENLL